MKGTGQRRDGVSDVVPRSATDKDIARVKQDYKNCAKRAKRAGFDGVELHAGYGYLLDQFLRDGAN
jgi:N-ethylmaleimide reductase